MQRVMTRSLLDRLCSFRLGNHTEQSALRFELGQWVQRAECGPSGSCCDRGFPSVFWGTAAQPLSRCGWGQPGETGPDRRFSALEAPQQIPVEGRRGGRTWAVSRGYRVP